MAAKLRVADSGYHAELDAAERASRDEITALQTRRLAWSLKHAYDNVAHYKKSFEAAGVHPTDFKQLSDLAKFPFTVKTDLRDNYPFNMFAVPREQLVRVHASSGTTGKPIVVGYTKADIDTWADVMARSIRAAGGRSGMLMHNAYGYGLFTGGLGAHYGAERLGCTVIPISGGMTERQVQLINDFKPDIITVTPSYMLAILDEFKRQGLDPRKSSLRFGIFGAEPWTNAMRVEIEQAFDMDASDIYGRGRRRVDPRRRAARRHGPAVRLQGRHVLDLPRQAGRGRGADGFELFAGAVGAEGGVHPHLPGQAVFGQGRGRLRPRLILRAR